MTKLKELLLELGISQTAFAKQLKEENLKSISWGHQIVRGDIRLSLHKAEMIVRLLRKMSGRNDLTVYDIMEVFPKDSSPFDLIQVSSQKIDEEEERLWKIVHDYMHENEILLPIIRKKSNAKKERYISKGLLGVFIKASLLMGIFYIGFLVGHHVGFPLQAAGGEERIPVPTLIGPEGEINDLTPKLRVEKVPRANGYEFSIFNLETRQNVLNEDTRNNFYNVPKNALCENVSYGWKAKIVRNGVWSSWASTMEFVSKQDNLPALDDTFTKELPQTPKPLSPLTFVNKLPAVLKVTPVKNATFYGFYIRDLETDAVIYFEYGSTKSSFELPEGVVKDGRNYRWNARAGNCAGFSGYSDAMDFLVNLN